MKIKTSIKTAFDWLFLTADNRYILGQFPNWAIISATVLWLVSVFVETQPYNNLFVILYRLMLMVWATMEIKTGVNHFRNILGTVVFAVILSGFLNQLL